MFPPPSEMQTKSWEITPARAAIQPAWRLIFQTWTVARLRCDSQLYNDALRTHGAYIVTAKVLRRISESICASVRLSRTFRRSPAGVMVVESSREARSGFELPS